jgi:TolA-binding protein
MATDSASTTTSPAAEPAPALWQAPIFALGVGALVAVFLCRPIWPDSPARRIDRDLRAARQALERPDPQVDQALKLAHRALESASDEAQERVGEAALLVGTCYIRMADKADPAHAAEKWQEAKQFLDQAEQAGVPEEDRPRLTYRLGKVGFHTGAPVQQVIDQLQESVEAAENNRVEGYDLLTRAYLRLTPPDLNRALEANRKLRDEVAEISEAELSAAQLTGGGLLLRLGKPEEARKSLEIISKQAPPHIQLRAQLLEARSYQDEKRWLEAARLYNTALALTVTDARVSIPKPGRVYYNLGLCYYNLDQPLEAADAWQKCVKLARGAEGPAAAIVLADLRLLESLPDKAASAEKAQEAAQAALTALKRAVENVTTAEQWKNPLVCLKRAREVFDRAVTKFRETGRYKMALDVLEPYRRIGLRRQLLVLEGELASEWARSRQEKAQAAKEILPDEEKKEIQELFARAAKVYGEAADLPDLKPKEQGKFLWLSISNHLAAGENQEAGSKLRRLVKMDLEPARLGEAWYRLGEECRTEGKPEDANTAYRECVRYDIPPYAFLARYRLALALLQAGDRDEAEATLVENVRQLRFEAERESLVALTESLLTLGNLLYQRRDYRRAARYLEDALGRIKDHPDATRGRYQLADSYRQIAAQENMSFLLGESMSAETRAHFQKEHRRWLQKAADEFAALDAYLEGGGSQGKLTREQCDQVPFITASCWFNLGQYEKALKVYQRLIVRHAKRPRRLVDALGGAVTCHAALGQANMVRQRLLQIQTDALPQLPQPDRDAWQQWLNEATKGLGRL